MWKWLRRLIYPDVEEPASVYSIGQTSSAPSDAYRSAHSAHAYDSFRKELSGMQITLPSGAVDKLFSLLAADHKIEAIKLIRMQATERPSLLQAKTAAERLFPLCRKDR